MVKRQNDVPGEGGFNLIKIFSRKSDNSDSCGASNGFGVELVIIKINPCHDLIKNQKSIQKWKCEKIDRLPCTHHRRNPSSFLWATDNLCDDDWEYFYRVLITGQEQNRDDGSRFHGSRTTQDGIGCDQRLWGNQKDNQISATRKYFRPAKLIFVLINSNNNHHYNIARSQRPNISSSARPHPNSSEAGSGSAGVISNS